MAFLQTRLTLTCILVTMMVAGCAKTEFAYLPGQEPVEDPDGQSEFYSHESIVPYKQKTDFFKQDQYEKNHTGISFEVIDSQGQSVSGLGKSDLEVFEEDTLVDQFDLSSSQQNLGQKADIVFVFDVTSSMQPTIDNAKAKVAEFVEDLRKQNIEAALCLVTFRDHTESKCEHIIENNPNTPQNENLDNFLTELSKISARGGGDTDENQLRALIDAARWTPWRTNSQKIAVLVTDAGFHYAPDNKGAAGGDAPTYEEAVRVVDAAGMMVFAIAPKKPGYNKPFDKMPALPEISGGEYFNYTDMVRGKISMSSIFSRIVERISTYYSVSYFVEDQSSSLDPKKPLNIRKFKIKTKNNNYRVRILSTRSNWPQGRPELRSEWKLSKKPRQKLDQLKIYVNGEDWRAQATLVKDNVLFKVYPPQGADIEVSYDTEKLLDGMNLKPITMPADLLPETILVTLNGKGLRIEDLGLSRDLEGRYVLDLFKLVNDPEDPFQVYLNKGLHVKIEGLIQK